MKMYRFYSMQRFNLGTGTIRRAGHLISIILLTGVLVLSCSKQKSSLDKDILIARVGDHVLTKNEFIERAEYTVRPPYCRGDNYIHKKIVLNSLIAEKLMALEAGTDNQLTQNVHFQRYLEGRREQAMRQWQYNEVAVKKVALDTAEIKKIYRLAGRKYNVSFITLNNSGTAQKILDEARSKEETLQGVMNSHGIGERVAERTVEFNKNENEAVLDALYKENISDGDFVGPLQAEDGSWLIMQVKGWTNQVNITNSAIQQRWNDVSQYLTDQKARAIYDTWVGEVMHGKKMEFDPGTFKKLVNIAGPLYVRSEKEKKEAFNQMYWGKKEQELPLDTLGKSIVRIRHLPLFRVDGKVWTVADFEKEMEIHPLVFRKRNFPQKEFAEQFKLAIVDMVRDRAVTEQAYQKGYDRKEAVQQYQEMWKDNMLAMYQKQQYLKKMNCTETNYLKVINDYLNPYVQSLQKKYQDQIKINTGLFEDVKLTSVDMIVLQQNVPFPIMVPSFPQLTTLNKLNYGQKMN